MLRTLIIDDEENARETIAEMLDLFCDNVTVVGQAEDVASGYDAIRKLQPDLILLDINMPDGTGFSLLKKFDKLDFKVIFITAYEEHAIKAFKFNALDYILKPIDSDELVTAIDRAENLHNKEFDSKRIETFLTNFSGAAKEMKQIVLKTSDSIHIVAIADIIRLESDRNYTRFYLNDGTKILVSTTLKEYDTMLHDYGFFRSHHSHLVNMSYLKRFDKSDGGFLVMKDDSIVAVSQRKRELLFALLDRM